VGSDDRMDPIGCGRISARYGPRTQRRDAFRQPQLRACDLLLVGWDLGPAQVAASLVCTHNKARRVGATSASMATARRLCSLAADAASWGNEDGCLIAWHSLPGADNDP
jgi:hypothetical protein